MQVTDKPSKISVTSFMNKRNKVGPSTDPCGTPLITGIKLDKILEIVTACLLLDKKALTKEKDHQKYQALSLVNNLLCDTESKAF